MLYVEGSTTNARSGVGLIVVSPKGHSCKHAVKFTFKTSNNEAECEALLAVMEIYNVLGVVYLKAFSDSRLVMSQVQGEFKARDPSMVAYSAQVKEKSSVF